MEKIAIVTSGGGMRCSYSAGVLYALAIVYGFKNPDILIATSGSCGSACFYLAGQYEAEKRVWTELLSTPKFLSFLRLSKIINVNYLIDEVFKKQCPLDVETLLKTQTDFYMPITDAVTRKGRYVSIKEGIDTFELLRAAKAIPYFFGEKVLLQGRAYIDGGIGISFEESIQKARDMGATTIIAVDNRTGLNNGRRKRLLAKGAGPNTIVISNPHMPAGLLTRNKERLTETFEHGYRNAIANQQLKDLLSVPINTFI